jgi:hypothetical protein
MQAFRDLGIIVEPVTLEVLSVIRRGVLLI